MATGTLGTTSNTALNAVTFNPSGATTSGSANTLSPADLAAISNSIVSDLESAATNPNGIVATGTSNSNTTLSSLAAVAGGPLSAIQLGNLVLGVGIPPGTFVIGFNNAQKTSILLSQAATTSSGGTKILIAGPQSQLAGFNFNGQLYIPRRGLVQVLPGDVVGVDNSGWPVLVSAAAIALAGSLWHKV